MDQSNPIRSEDKKQQDGFSGGEMQAMISASTSMEQATAINHARTQMIGESNVLKREIAVAKSKGGDPVDLEEKLAGLEGEIGDVTARIIAKYGKFNKAINDSLSKDSIDNKQGEDSEGKSTTIRCIFQLNSITVPKGRHAIPFQTACCSLCYFLMSLPLHSRRYALDVILLRQASA